MNAHEYGEYDHISPNHHNPHVWIVHPENLTMGHNVWCGAFCVLDATGGLEIGDEVSIASGAHIYTHSTALHHISEGRVPKRVKKVTIGDYAVIGANAVVYSDVGDHAIVQACSFHEWGKVSPYTLVAGNPAKFVMRLDT